VTPGVALGRGLRVETIIGGRLFASPGVATDEIGVAAVVAALAAAVPVVAVVAECLTDATGRTPS